MKILKIATLFMGVFCAPMALSLTAISAKAESLIIASEGAYSPFNYFDSNNQLIGFDIDIAKALCEKMKVECSFMPVPFEGLIPGLVGNKYDAIIASLGSTPEREEIVDFSDGYYTSITAITVPKNSDIKDTSIESLQGKTLGVQVSSIQAIYADDVYGVNGVDVKAYPTVEMLTGELKSQRVDALFVDLIPMLDWVSKDGKDCCKILGTVEETKRPVRAVIQKGSPLKQRFNQAIQDIRADGTYQKISNKYFGVDIY